MKPLMRRAAGRLLRSGWHRQQLAAAAGGCLLAAAAVVASVAGWQRVATILAGLFVIGSLIAVLQARRRLDQRVDAVARQNTGVVQRLEQVQRQVMAAVENERLAGHDRHAALLASVACLQKTLEQLIGDPAPTPTQPDAGAAAIDRDGRDEHRPV